MPCALGFWAPQIGSIGYHSLNTRDEIGILESRSGFIGWHHKFEHYELERIIRDAYEKEPGAITNGPSTLPISRL